MTAEPEEQAEDRQAEEVQEEDPFWRYRKAGPIDEDDHQPQDWGGGGI